MDIAVQRALGGTGALWGGRCVPFGPIDFEARAGVPHSGWPIGYDDVAPYFAAACAHIGCGAAAFEDPLAGFEPGDRDFDFRKVER